MRTGLLIMTAVGLTAGCRASADEEEILPEPVVHSAAVVRGTVHRYITAYGTVEPEPAGEGRPAAGAVVSPVVSGVIAEIDAVEGRRVARGDLLFRLDSRLAEAATAKARQEAEFAQQALARQQDLLGAAVTSQRAVQEARLRLDQARSDLAGAETHLAYHRIVAPLAGTVVRISARLGQAVDPGAVLASVVDPGRLVVSAEVPSREAVAVKAGQRVLLGADTVARGTVRLVGRDVDPANDTYKVLVAIPPGAMLVPGSFTDLRIVAEEHRQALLVPVVSLVTRAGEGSWLMAVRGDSAVRVPVTPGLRDGGMVEVVGDQLSEGLAVVTTEAYSLPKATKVRRAPR